MLVSPKFALVICSAALLACGNDGPETNSKTTGSVGSAGTGSGGGSSPTGAGGSGGSGGTTPTGAAGTAIGSGGSTSSGGSAGSGGAQGGGGTTSGGDAMPGPTDGGGSDASSGGADGGPVLPKRVLLYHFTTINIPTVPAQLALFKAKLDTWGFTYDDSVDPAKFTDAGLASYGAVAMINACGEPFGATKPDRPQSEALQRFVQKGGGLFGTHCAVLTFTSANPPALYNQLFGGRGGNGFFDGMSNCRRTSDHVTSAQLPATFAFNGNLDNADYVAPDSTVLVRCMWSGPNGKDVPVSWYRTEGSGRVFYTNFAKVDSDLTDMTIGDHHIVEGLSWILRR